MYDYQDTLVELNKNTSLSEKIRFIHGVLKRRFSFIARVSVALYDPKSDMLKTFIDSSGGDQPLVHYQATLSDSPSLQEILVEGRPRVVNDLDVHGGPVGKDGARAVGKDERVFRGMRRRLTPW